MFGGPIALTSANLSSQASSLSVEVRIGPSGLNCFKTALGLLGRNLGLWRNNKEATHVVWFREDIQMKEYWKGQVVHTCSASTKTKARKSFCFCCVS